MAKFSAPAASHTESASRPAERAANAPVFSCRHRALKAAVWRNETDNGTFFNVTVSRAYKEGEQWHESSSFGYDDVLIVAELLRTCHSFISREMTKQSEQARE